MVEHKKIQLPVFRQNSQPYQKEFRKTSIFMKLALSNVVQIAYRRQTCIEQHPAFWRPFL